MRVDLPEPETPVTDTKQPSGISTSIPFKLCSRAPRTTSQSPRGSRRMVGHGDRALSREVLAGDRGPALHEVRDRAGADDLAAVLAGSRPDVDDVVGDADRLLVVLDDEDGVAEVAQA